MRKTAFLLAALLVVCTACGKTTPSADTTAPAGTTEPAESTIAPDDPQLPPKTFGGATVNFLVISETHNANNYSQEIYAEEENGDPINDAVYRRNAYVEETYDVKITEYRSSNPQGEALTAVLANEDVYQVLMMGMEECMAIASYGGLLNLNDVEYIDLSRPWWDQNVNSMVTCNDITYLAVGDINIMDDNATWVTFFNKKIADNYRLPDFYKLVDEGKWTMDVLLENARLTNFDLNGDNVISWEADRFGIGTDMYNFTNLLLGAGERYWDFNEEGNLEPVINNERAINVIEKIFQVLYDEPTTVNANKYDVPSANTTILRNSFGEDRMSFYIASLLTYPLMRHMETDFGLLPMPKYDEQQEAYYSPILPRNTSALAIPVTNANAEMTGYIVEAMAAKSSTTLRPAYYTYTIEGKGLRDDDSARMLDIILASRVVDFGSIFDFGGMVDSFQKMTIRNDTNFASTYARNVESAMKICAEMMEKLY
ncbi:MAG: hypothetical protein IJF67_09775 [Clostridia bacterium]|nr:hypothetical protein [Clostridia bacterium]